MKKGRPGTARGAMKTAVRMLEGRMTVTWAIGDQHGALHFAQGDDGRWFVRTEGKSKAFAVEVLKAWLLDSVEVTA